MGIAITWNIFNRPFVAGGTTNLVPELKTNASSRLSFACDATIAPVDVYSFFIGSQFFVTLSAGSLPAGVVFDGRFLTGVATTPTTGQIVSFTASTSSGSSTLTLLIEVVSPSWEVDFNTSSTFEIRKSVGNGAPPALTRLNPLQFQIGE